jgi:hypothetical protein
MYLFLQGCPQHQRKGHTLPTQGQDGEADGNQECRTVSRPHHDSSTDTEETEWHIFYRHRKG